MIYCGECGAQNNEDRERCQACNAPLTLPLIGPELDAPVLGRRTSHTRSGINRALLFLPLLAVALLGLYGGLRLASLGFANSPRAAVPPPETTPTSAATPYAGVPQGIPSPQVTETSASPVATVEPSSTATPSPTESLSPPPSPTPADIVVVPRGRIAFSSDRDRPGRKRVDLYDRDIYLVRADGKGKVQRLTGEPGYDGQPSWSPTGEQIAFASARAGLGQIWVMSPDGSNPRQLTNDPAGASLPDWSPNGRHILYDGGPAATSDIWRIDVNTGKTLQLTKNKRRETAPAWSRNGKQIAFMALVKNYWQIFVMNADGTRLKQITSGRIDHRYPRWFPDGRIIFNTRYHDSGRVGNIFRMNADGSSLTQLTYEGEGANGRPFPSPDGRFIAFNSTHLGDNYEIYVSRPDGSEARRLTNTPADDFEPAWSP